MVRRRSAPFTCFVWGLPNSVGILPSSMRSSICFLIRERGKELVTAKAPAEANHLGAQKRCFLQAFAFPHRAGACRAWEAPLMRDVIAPVFFRDTHHACRLVSEPLLVLPLSHAHAQALSFMLSFVRSSLREGERRARSREVSVPESESNSTHAEIHFSPV